MEQRSGGRSCESAEDDQTADVWSSGLRSLEGPRGQRGVIEKVDVGLTKWGLRHQKVRESHFHPRDRSRSVLKSANLELSDRSSFRFTTISLPASKPILSDSSW